MKKIMVIGLVIVMCLSMGLTAFAANGGYIQSPTKNKAPELVEVTPASEKLIITITPFAKRNTLTGETAANFTEAHEDIVAIKSVDVLVPEVKAAAEKANVKVENLGISDLFDVSANMELTGEVTIKLKAETAKHFVALLHYHNDTWEVVENATVKDGVLTFSVKELSPFAIVVDREKATVSAPLTADNTASFVVATLMLVSALGVIAISKKVKA
ncbi:MAG: hypothetical protein J6B22_04435 [Clostridia bacterium]|nr:hypothetical protein [Clostridia bacterium]